MLVTMHFNNQAVHVLQLLLFSGVTAIISNGHIQAKLGDVEYQAYQERSPILCLLLNEGNFNY